MLHGQSSCSKNVHAGLPQGSILVSLLLLIYVNDLSENLFLIRNILLMIVYSFSSSQSRWLCKRAKWRIEKKNEWAIQWKMSFNSDLNKRVQEVVFSSKIKTLTNPSATFNNSNVSQAFSKTPRHCIIFKVNIWRVY